jgi:hypothetical protein
MVRDVVPAAEHGDGPLRGHDERDGEHRTEGDREPDAVDPGLEGVALAARAGEAGYLCGGGVGEEHAQADDREQDVRGEAQAGELRGAEVSDDRGVGEDEQRLGDQEAAARKNPDHDY